MTLLQFSFNGAFTFIKMSPCSIEGGFPSLKSSNPSFMNVHDVDESLGFQSLLFIGLSYFVCKRSLYL